MKEKYHYMYYENFNIIRNMNICKYSSPSDDELHLVFETCWPKISLM